MNNSELKTRLLNVENKVKRHEEEMKELRLISENLVDSILDTKTHNIDMIENLDKLQKIVTKSNSINKLTIKPHELTMHR